MTNRLKLHEILCDVLESRNVYFQPPESVKMKYPAIVYGLDDIDNTYANDGVYASNRKYLITVIDKNPDSAIIGRMASLPKSRFNRHLNHDVFTLFY